jgi:methyl-accepting chemotaxis protein
MSFIQTLGIRRFLWASSAVTVGLALIGGAYSWSQLTLAAEEAADANDRLVPQLVRTADLEQAIVRSSLLVRHSMLVRTPADRDATLAELAQMKDKADRQLQEFEAAVRSEQGRRFAEAMRAESDVFWKHGAESMAMIAQGRKEEAVDHLMATLVPARNRLLQATGAARQYQKTYLSEMVAASQDDARKARLGLVVAMASMVLVLSANALLLMAHLRRRIGDAEAVARRIGAKDLSQPVPTSGRDEFVPMLQALAGMQDALAAMAGAMRHSAERIDVASREVASGNADLSQRTERTAGALQQTAGSITQLNGGASQMAQSAGTARELAASASAVAQRGGEVIGEVVSTMSDISTSSRRIAEIIGTIDGIAFQTNILALNASVEAARAGEQGRGFAVVADEVRLLAQRSADAARQIKQLIGTSVEKVEQGSRLVDDAGRTMAEIVSGSQRVNDVIGEISAAAAEQSAGIGRVEGAVRELDQSTQQNAALVEESAAAAESLREQARQLMAMVETFRLEPMAGAARGAAAGVPAPALATATAPSTAQPPPPAPAARPAGAGAATRPGAKAAAAIRRAAAQAKAHPGRAATATAPALAVAAAPKAAPPALSAPATPAPAVRTTTPESDDEWQSF